MSSYYDIRWQRRFDATQKRTQLKERAVTYCGGKCKICGYNRSLAALEFHHEDPKSKEFNISSKMSWDTIVVELEKTVLVCSNCHKEIHAGYHPQYLSLVDSDNEDFGDLSTL